MTRLRLAQSSPERMAELLTQLREWCDDRAGYAEGTRVTGELWERGARLLLRWYAHGHVNHQWAHEQILEHGRPSRDYYGTAWRSTYPDQLWPQDGDERMRRELDE